MSKGSTPLPPFRHLETGTVCPVPATAQCPTELVHHRPRHAHPFNATTVASTPPGRHRRVVPPDAAPSFRYATTEARGVTR